MLSFLYSTKYEPITINISAITTLEFGIIPLTNIVTNGVRIDFIKNASEPMIQCL